MLRASGRVRETMRAPTSTPVPQQISNLALWLDVTQLTGVSNGAVVASLSDLSGSGHDVTGTAAGGSSGAVYRTGAINGLPVLDFDGSATRLGATWAPSGALTLLVVGIPRRTYPVAAGTVDTAATLGALRIEFGNAFASTTTRYAVFEGAVVGYYLNGHAATFQNPASAIPTNVGIVTACDATAATGGVLRLGCDTGNTNMGLLSIAEVLAYTRQLTAGERASLDHYFSSKYGITVSD